MLIEKLQNENNKEPKNKTYYIEESVKIIENIIMKADPILSELAAKVKQFEKVSQLSSKERD